MNYMKQVAEMLDLEWDDVKQESEVFEIERLYDGDRKYKLALNDNRLQVMVNLKENVWKPTSWIESILGGNVKILKILKESEEQ